MQQMRLQSWWRAAAAASTCVLVAGCPARVSLETQINVTTAGGAGLA